MSSTSAAVESDVGGRRLAVWLLVVLGVQLLVLSFSADAVYSGSDAGGRAAAVVAAADRGSCEHDLGYWAAPWDPAARVHPLVNTLAVGEQFVQPVPILFVCAASPLVSAGGIDGALVLSIGGVFAAAAGAWLLERTAGGDGTWSLVLVGLIGPVAFYGSDVWEHAPAVGLALFGTGLFARVLVHGRPGWMNATVAGASWGLAATMRTEIALVALALVVGLVVVPETRAMLRTLWRDALVSAVVALMVIVGDIVLEAAIVGTRYRSDRSGGQASDALDRTDGWQEDVVATTVGLAANDTDWVVMGFGGLFVLLIFGLSAGSAGIRLSRATEWTVIALLAVILAIRIADGPGFVPGMLAAAPVGVAGLWTLRRSVAPPVIRAVAIGATLCLPVVWALQWRGNLIAQWGGRYVLLSGGLLTVCGVLALNGHRRRLVRPIVFGIAVAIGVLGLVWKVERSHIAHDVVSDLAALSCDEVLVITTPFVPREGGADRDIARGELADGCRFLSARPGDLPYALEVARSSGATQVSVLIESGGLQPVPPREGDTVRGGDYVDLGSLAYDRYEIMLGR